MSDAAEKLKEELSRLSIEERAELACYLIRSLDDEPEDDVAAAWEAELQRRYEEIKAGTAVGYPADQVFAEMRAKYS